MSFKHRLPGHLATALLALATTMWTFWGFGEMYYEGWWGAWTNRLPYLMPMVICLTFALLALHWPRFGGWTIITLGGAFTTWRWLRQAQLGTLTLRWALDWFPISGVFVLVGILFLLDGRYRRLQDAAGWQPSARWWRRNLRCLAVFVPSFLTALGVTAFFIPLLASRTDDSYRGARLIQGNGVSLIWAPAGPGWSAGAGPSKETGELLPGANLSWNEIATYGVPPVGFGEKFEIQRRDANEADMQATGLCRYLSEDGTDLMADPQNMWRMPTTDELVRSLVRGDEPAGCVWDGISSNAECTMQPNKDTPLWNPNASPIYYYSSEEYDADTAWYVPYTGGGLYGGVIGGQSKRGGNARHGYRCVREP
jgi:hypothetical protein